MSDYRTESPAILRDFLSYHETVKAHSQRTVDEYYLDLRNFFRYLKQMRDPKLRVIETALMPIIGYLGAYRTASSMEWDLQTIPRHVGPSKKEFAGYWRNYEAAEAAYAALRAQGIKAGHVDEAPGVFNKLFGKGKRWMAIAVLVVGGGNPQGSKHSALCTQH